MRKSSIAGAVILCAITIGLVATSYTVKSLKDSNPKIDTVYGNPKVLDKTGLYMKNNYMLNKVQDSSYSVDHGFKSNSVLLMKGGRLVPEKARINEYGEIYIKEGEKNKVISTGYRLYINPVSENKNEAEITSSFKNSNGEFLPVLDKKIILKYRFRYRNFFNIEQIHSDNRNIIKFIFINSDSDLPSKKKINNSDIYFLSIDVKTGEYKIKEIASLSCKYPDNVDKDNSFIDIKTILMKNYLYVMLIPKSGDEYGKTSFVRIDTRNLKYEKLEFADKNIEKLFISSVFNMNINTISDDLIGVSTQDRREHDNIEKGDNFLFFSVDKGIVELKKRVPINDLFFNVIKKKNNITLNADSNTINEYISDEYVTLKLTTDLYMKKGKSEMNSSMNYIAVYSKNTGKLEYLGKIDNDPDYRSLYHLDILK